MKRLVKYIVPVFFWEWCRVWCSALRRIALDLTQTFSVAHPYLLWKLFRTVRVVRPRYTMVKAPRLRVLWELSGCINYENIEGAIVECGVWNGGAAALMAVAQGKREPQRDVYLFDSFQQLPRPVEKDGKKAGAMYEEGTLLGGAPGEVSRVRDAFCCLHLPLERVRIIEGWFKDTFPVTPIPKIALLHIDADWYESVKLCLETYYASVVSGGFVVFDDYGSWEGCKRAVDEFMKAYAIHEPLCTRDGIGFYFRKIKNR